MKNKYTIGLALVGMFFTHHIFAATVGTAKSGIDLWQSTIQIDYTKYSADDHTVFECLGESPALVSDAAFVQKNFLEILGGFDSDPIGGNRFSYEGASANEFIELALDDPSEQSLRNCFQQAGTYAVTITLADALGQSDSEVFNFVIKANDPNTQKSTITNSGGGCDTKYANNSQECQLELVLKDEFENRVLELSAQNIKVYDGRGSSVDPWENDDANLGTSFLEGVKLFGQYLFEKLDISNSISVPVDANAESLLSFSSLTPSLKTNDNGWQDLTTRNYPVVINTPEINTDGSVGTADAIQLGSVTAPLSFLPPIELNPRIEVGVMDGGSFKSLSQVNSDAGYPDCGDPAATENTVCPEWGQGQVAWIEILENHHIGLLGLTGQVMGALQRFMYPPNLYKIQYAYDMVTDPGPPEVTESQNVFSGDTSYPSPDLNFYYADTPLSSQGGGAQSGGSTTAYGEYPTETDYNYAYIWDFIPPPISEWLNTGSATNSLEIKAKTSYTLDSKLVSYFAGKHQLDADNNVLDIFIEGFVSGSLEKVALIENLVRIGNINAKDIRETITSNAFKLARGAKNIETTPYTFDANDFNDQGTVVVKGANVTIGNLPTETVLLPSGKKTLIVVDGNVNIKSNTAYDDDEDSFGIILVNTNATIDSSDTNTYPQTGNIFVHSEVMNIVGSYFADGGIMTQDSIPGSGDIFANVDHSSEKQLLLTGTLITKNTIGGAVTPDANNTYTTPWGRIENDGGDIGKNIAKRYDLRLLRAFSPTGGANLNAGEDGHPFILRDDRKAVNMSPPGFNTQETIGR